MIRCLLAVINACKEHLASFSDNECTRHLGPCVSELSVQIYWNALVTGSVMTRNRQNYLLGVPEGDKLR